MKIKRHKHYVATPTVLQMEATECGAASLSIILRYYGRYASLEELREACGVSRDGAKAGDIVRAAEHYGLHGKGALKKYPPVKTEKEGLEIVKLLPAPSILFWSFNHFLVLEGVKGKKIMINDPAGGHYSINFAKFTKEFTGVVISFSQAEQFVKKGHKTNILRGLAERLQGEGKRLLFTILISLLLVIPGIIIPGLAKIFIDNIVVAGLHDWLQPMLIVMLVAITAQTALIWVQQKSLLILQMKLAINASTKFYQHLLRLPVQFFHQRYAGDINHKIESNDRIAAILSADTSTSAASIFSILLYGVVLFALSPLLMLIVLLFAVINVAIFQFISTRLTDASRQLLREQGKLMGIAMNGLQIMETLRVQGVENRFFARWIGHHTKLLNTNQGSAYWRQLLAILAALMNSLSLIVVLCVGTFLVMQWQISIGTLFAFSLLMVTFNKPINQLVIAAVKLKETEGDLDNLNDVLCYPQDDYSIRPAKSAPKVEAEHLHGDIELKDIAFGYHLLEPPLIKDFNFHTFPGKHTALVGLSGSGKSTIAKLVTGLYKPWQGEVLYDHKQVCDITGDLMHHSVGVVTQEIYLFAGTVRDNISLWDDSIADEEIAKACLDACILDDVMSRPSGLFAEVDEGGNNFSGGQRQRIEIAKALVRNPSILILDEATSALDSVTEDKINANIRARGCSCIIVAHRLSTIRDCDEIIVMDKGRIIERGKHADMINQDGPYAKLIAMEVG